MEFYQTVQNRRTVREFSARAVPPEALERILNAGLQAPSHNHLREWEFVVLQEAGAKENALRYVEEWARVQGENRKVSAPASPAQEMYAYAMPRQNAMLQGCPCVVLPFFKAGQGVLRAASLSALNPFASIWCVIENIFLAAAAEGLACAMRIPVGEEAQQVARAVNAPGGYLMPCYIGLGYAASNAAQLEQTTCTAAQRTHYSTW